MKYRYTLGALHTLLSVDLSSPEGKANLLHENRDFRERASQIIQNKEHPMHHFVKLCVQQGVSEFEGGARERFSAMASQALERAKNRVSGGPSREEIPLPRRQDSLPMTTPRHNSTGSVYIASQEELSTQLTQNQNPEDLDLVCSIVDNIVRRQVTHS